VARTGRHRARRQRPKLGFSPWHELKVITYATPLFWGWWQVYDSTLGKVIHG
jgi:hypothetical protein